MIQPEIADLDIDHVEEVRYKKFQEVKLCQLFWSKIISGIELYWNEKNLDIDIHSDRNTYLIQPNVEIQQRLEDDLLKLEILKFSYKEEVYE